MLGNKLQEARTNKGLSQEEVAQELFVTRQTISRWEKNSTLPNIYTLNTLCKLYDINIDSLLSESNHKTPKINYLALFGSIMFNSLIFSGIMIILAVFITSIWFMVVFSLISPLLLVIANVSGAQSFDITNAILSVLLFVAAYFGFKPVLKLSQKLVILLKKYFKINMNMIKG